MSDRINKLAVFGIVEQLADLRDDRDRTTVQALRERLVLSHGRGTPASQPLLDALHDLFMISGPWARGIEQSAQPTRNAAKRAIALLV